jgi:hypothetical protein
MLIFFLGKKNVKIALMVTDFYNDDQSKNIPYLEGKIFLLSTT